MVDVFYEMITLFKKISLQSKFDVLHSATIEPANHIERNFLLMFYFVSKVLYIVVLYFSSVTNVFVYIHGDFFYILTFPRNKKLEKQNFKVKIELYVDT